MSEPLQKKPPFYRRPQQGFQRVLMAGVMSGLIGFLRLLNRLRGRGRRRGTGGPSHRAASYWMGLLLCVAVGVYGWQTWPYHNLHADVVFRFFALPAQYQLDPDERVAAVQIVRQALHAELALEAPADAPPELSEIFSMRDPREVWVTLYVPGLPPAKGMALEPSLYRGLRTATRHALSNHPEGAAFITASPAPAIQIDILQARARLWTLSHPYLFFALEPGVDGIVIHKGTQHHFQLPSEAITRGLLTPRKNGRLGCIYALMSALSEDIGLPSDGWRTDGSVTLERFRTVSFGEPVPGSGVRDFLRANVLLSAQDVTAERIYASILEGVRFLMESVQHDGRFRYEYFPNDDRTPDTYNRVRHAGLVYGLLELYRQLGDERVLRVAQQALPFLVAGMHVPGEDKRLLALMEGENAHTGGTALAALAWVTLPAALRPGEVAGRSYDAILKGLGQFLIQMVDEDGAVFANYQASVGRKNVVREPLYTPGETLLALARLTQVTGDRVYLISAERIARRQVQRFEWFREADHWVIQGLAALHEVTGDPMYATQCLRMADTFVQSQYPPNNPPFADYFGAWRRELEMPRTTRAGSRSEALRAAVRTVWRLQHDSRQGTDEPSVAQTVRSGVGSGVETMGGIGAGLSVGMDEKAGVGLSGGHPSPTAAGIGVWGVSARDAQGKRLEDALLFAAKHQIEQQFRPENAYFLLRPERALGGFRAGLVDNHLRIDFNQHAMVGLMGALEVAVRREGKVPFWKASSLEPLGDMDRPLSPQP